MALLANSVGLTDPSENFVIQFLLRMKAEEMHLIAWRDIFDFRETRIFKTPGQDHMTDNSVSPEADGCETHSHLKRNASFLRHHTHRSATLHQLRELVEE